jgi:DNA-binding GntR family transcriptional regulator
MNLSTSLLNESVLPVKAITLRDQVYDQIRLAILERRLKPGDHVREQEWTKLLEVSRTPLREALGLLERDGLVQNFPNRGWFVTKFTPAEIEEIFFIRSGLENLAAERSIHRLMLEDYTRLETLIQEQQDAIEQNQPTLRSKIDLQFHRTLVALADNRRLLQMWENIAVQCSMAFNYHTVTMPDYDHMQGMVDHRAILGALRSGKIANVYATNNAINTRVARQCIEGFQAVEAGHSTPVHA